MTKAAIYARVSMDKEAEDERFQDPENQLQALRTMAEGRGWQIVEEYVDKVSGGSSNRPAFSQMRSDARRGKFKVILIWSLDRFSREGIVQTLSYIKELKGHNVGIISHQESWMDTRQDSPMAEMIIAMLAWFAQMERQRISQRTKAGIARLRAIGQWHGGRPTKRKGRGRQRQRRR